MFIGDWERRLMYVMDVWGINLTGLKPTHSFRSIKDMLMALPAVLNQ
ncbi:hypothetical protein [Vulcanisaeta souniana]|nr:hypothetical protein [Vulcanisaeta souniana]